MTFIVMPQGSPPDQNPSLLRDQPVFNTNSFQNQISSSIFDFRK